jgi:transcriptional regulator with XRE-family HTH domain
LIKLNERLRELRVKCGYTQSQVAKLLSIDRSTYAYYETGKTRPDVTSLMMLSKIFNIPINELLADESLPKSVADSAPMDYVSGKKNSSRIFELSQDEKELVGAFRVCPPEVKKKILNLALDSSEKKDG